ncbi:MAG: hypothetical protein ACM3H8_09920, partial [Sphingobacteriales bacterium]
MFLRIRPGYKEQVLNKFKASGLKFEVIDENCIALPNSSKIEDIVTLNKEVNIQDYNSQRAGELMQLSTINLQPSTYKVWDCCAASGGKSILVKDV